MPSLQLGSSCLREMGHMGTDGSTGCGLSYLVYYWHTSSYYQIYGWEMLITLVEIAANEWLYIIDTDNSRRMHCGLPHTSTYQSSLYTLQEEMSQCIQNVIRGKDSDQRDVPAATPAVRLASIERSTSWSISIGHMFLWWPQTWSYILHPYDHALII